MSKIGMGVIGPNEMMEMLGGKRTTIAEHYGVNEKDYDSWVRDMLCELIKNPDKSCVVDKCFPKLCAEDRAKVFAMANALQLRQDVEF